MVRNFIILEMDQSRPILRWTPQLWGREKVYVAEDVRGTYQIFSHTMKGVQIGIESKTNQKVSNSSLYESKLGQLKQGRTSGTFTVKCFDREEGIQYLNSTSNSFKVRVVSLINVDSLRIGARPV